MDHALDASSRPRRRRIARGKRSRSGCHTCSLKRVKCDEQHPTCSRCQRLGLCCDWPSPGLSLGQRRRGAGPIKSREPETWTPHDILPHLSRVVIEQGTFTDGDDEQDLYVASKATTDGEPQQLHVISEAHEDGHSLENIALAQQESRMDSGSAIVPAGDMSFLMYSDISAFPFSTSFLEADTTVSPPSSISDDAGALEFHRTVVAGLRSTRSPTRSSHFAFGYYALRMPMVLHLLLAVSHTELVIYHGRGAQAPREALMHFGAGSSMLLQRLSSVTSTSNHIEMTLSYLYLYHFWLRREHWNLPKLQDLSMSLLLYVKAFALDDACGFAYHQLSEPGKSKDCTQLALVAKILTYLFDRDGFCAFSGFAGMFATEATKSQALWVQIWQLSLLAFPPQSDLEKQVLEFYLQLIWIHHQINCLSQSSAAFAGVDISIAERLRGCKRDHDRIFDMVKTAGTGELEPPTFAFVTVTFYHALVIYLHRSRDLAFGSRPVGEDIRAALSELVRVAWHAIETVPVQLLERFQWSLLIAGTETDDPVHREWFSAKLSDPTFKHLYPEIQRVKRQHGGCISMQRVRELFISTQHAQPLG